MSKAEVTQLRRALEDAVRWWEAIELLKQTSGSGTIELGSDYKPNWLKDAIAALKDGGKR